MGELSLTIPAAKLSSGPSIGQPPGLPPPPEHSDEGDEQGWHLPSELVDSPDASPIAGLPYTACVPESTAGPRSIADRVRLAREAMQAHLDRLEAAYQAEISRTELIVEERIREQQALEAQLLEVRARRQKSLPSSQGPPAAPPG